VHSSLAFSFNLRHYTTVEMMVYNAMLSAPPLTLLVLVTGEFNLAVERIASMSDDFGFMVGRCRLTQCLQAWNQTSLACVTLCPCVMF